LPLIDKITAISVLPVLDNQLLSRGRLAARTPKRIVDPHRAHLESLEDAPHERHGVDRDEAFWPFRIALRTLLRGRVCPVSVGLPVRRVTIEKRVLAVVFIYTFMPGQVLTRPAII